MRLLTIVQLTVGLMLSGCTFNHHSSVNKTFDMYAPITTSAYTPPPVTWESPPVVPAEPPAKSTEPARPGHCSSYEPLRIGAPQQVDLKRLQNAQSDQEITRILLENIGALNRQISEFNARQQKHYRAWRKHCAEL